MPRWGAVQTTYGRQLAPYRRRRSRRPYARAGACSRAAAARHDDTFVIQEHHARRLHWDFRLKRGGMPVWWALPRAFRRTRSASVLPCTPRITFWTFEGEIPQAR